jgi:hypothetical protein
VDQSLKPPATYADAVYRFNPGLTKIFPSKPFFAGREPVKILKFSIAGGAGEFFSKNILTGAGKKGKRGFVKRYTCVFFSVTWAFFSNSLICK